MEESTDDAYILLALEQLSLAKESKKLSTLKQNIKIAAACLEGNLNTHTQLLPKQLEEIFLPFQQVCQAKIPSLTIIAITCLTKTFTDNFWIKHHYNQKSVPGQPPEETARDTADTTSVNDQGELLADGAIDEKKDEEKEADEEINSNTDGQESRSKNSNRDVMCLVIDTICDTFSDTIDEKVQTLIIKALSTAVCYKIPTSIHGGILLKCIRTIYNCFLLGKTGATQFAAQSNLTNMVDIIFARVPVSSKEYNDEHAEEEMLDAKIKDEQEDKTETETVDGDGDNSADNKDEGESDEFSERKIEIIIETSNSPTKTESLIQDEVSPTGFAASPSDESLSSEILEEAAAGALALQALASKKIKKAQEIVDEDGEDDIAIKDAYLVFRALCKLSMKPIAAPEGSTDIKSLPMRSKLLSLHLLHYILSNKLPIFFTYSPSLFALGNTTVTPQRRRQLLFVHAVKQYLCLSLSRNSASVIPQVFEVSMEIFGRMLFGLRGCMKKEISVIFTEIILPIIESRSSITYYQRSSVLGFLSTLLSTTPAVSGRVLVEIYLNYDCDVEVGDSRMNIWERLIASLSKVMNATSPVSTISSLDNVNNMVTDKYGLPNLSSSGLVAFTKEQSKELYSRVGSVGELKKRALSVLVIGVLGSLLSWYDERVMPALVKKDSENDIVDELSTNDTVIMDTLTTSTTSKVSSDDPAAFENLKHRKQVLAEGIKKFNFKPKKGMQFLIDSGCIPSKSPVDIAKFLMNTPGVNKSMIGEYLGEGDELNISIMHAFVDELDFTGMKFTDALRLFLQSFRLPGEAQKIDRFMLKFAERYLMGNSSTFGSADTAYVLAYSVIMLNTDQHNTQVKKRMTVEDFIKNNRGIDEGKDIDKAYLEEIFSEISKKEIVLNEEQQARADANAEGTEAKKKNEPTVYSLPFVGFARRDIALISYASENMALKTEAMFNTILTRGRSGTGNAGDRSSNIFYSASHYMHIKQMFQITWMSILTALTNPLQQLTDDSEIIRLCLIGFKHSTRISCIFDMELERKAFITTFAKFAQLSKLSQMKSKNLEAIRTLLEIAYVQGDYLADSWLDVVLCISQLEKLQLVGSVGGVEIQRVQRMSAEHSRSSSPAAVVEVQNSEATSQTMAIAVDRIFSGSVRLSGEAIVHFVKALCQVSWDEITSSSANNNHPRMNSLQRLIEISYYNMKRIRMEWSNIWAILGEHFNKVGCHQNQIVALFALDKLRQLSMKFLEIEELSNFKFQKDFLKPFEHIIGNNPDSKIKDMVLTCLQQMIQAKSKSMKSGWKTLFAAFIKAARETNESVVSFAFDIMKMIFQNNFYNITANHAFADFISCLVEFCKNRNFVKINLQSIEMIRQSIGKLTDQSRALSSNSSSMKNDHDSNALPVTLMSIPASISSGISKLAAANNGASTEEDNNIRFWFPTLFGLYEVIMTCDLEVRTRALTYLFETLKKFGGSFSRDFWEVISKGVLFPIFDDLKITRQEHSKFANKEDMSVWLSTTLIQALRQFVDLFGHYYDDLYFLLDGLLELLTTCMTQENETLARIGSTCLEQFIEVNGHKLDSQSWDKICQLFNHLCNVTTPSSIFLYSTEQVQEGDEIMSPTSPASARSVTDSDQKKDFQNIIAKCVLHLLIIQTINEIIVSASSPEGKNTAYLSMKSSHLFMLTGCLEQSYRFAQKFNGDMDLRTSLYKKGFMKQLPNLLKQETTSVSIYVVILIKMMLDKSEERKSNRSEISKRLIPLSLEIIQNFNKLEPESNGRSVGAWRPVVVIILNALLDFEEEQFRTYMPIFYNDLINLLLQDIAPDIRLVVHSLLTRTGVVFQISK